MYRPTAPGRPQIRTQGLSRTRHIHAVQRPEPVHIRVPDHQYSHVRHGTLHTDPARGGVATIMIKYYSIL